MSTETKLMDVVLTSVAAEGAGHYRTRFTNTDRREQMIDLLNAAPLPLQVGKEYEIFAREKPAKAPL